jgi:glutamyl-Q tRNA(Asp) synthetase
MVPAERKQRMAAGEPYALRLDMDAARKRVGALSWREGEEGSIAADPAAWGDVVLARKDSPTSYHLSVVVDDALQGVTHIARGRDLYPSTSVHRLLQELLGLPAPFYRHHRLILDSDGRKLSKSNRSTAIRELRAAGATPSDIRGMTGLI